MKFKNLFFILILFAGISASAQIKYSKVRIYPNSQDIATIQKSGIDFENISGKYGQFIDFELSVNELKKLNEKNIKYEILIDDMSAFYKKRYAESVKAVDNNIKGVNYVTPSNFNYGSMGGFLTLDEIYAELDEMTNLYPNLISAKFTIGNTQTIEGRNVFAIKISDNPASDEPEPEVLYTSLTHAREPAAMQALIWYMWYLLENYGTNDEITHLVDNLELFFIPVVNPDGYQYNYSTNPNGGGMWRKNKRDNNNDAFFDENNDGVDLNRNFGFKWAYNDSGSSPDASSNTFRGTTEFSEPETQIIRDFTNAHEFLLAHNHHTYSDLLIIPFGYDAINTPDDDFLRTSAYLMASENGYTVGQAWEIIYAVNGDADDWMYGEQVSKPKIFAFTQETGGSADGFWPSQERIIPLCEESYLSNLFLARLADSYAELTDNSSAYISQTGYLKFNLKRMGLSGTGNYTVSVVPDNVVFSSLGNAKNIILPNALSNQFDSIAYTLDNSIQYGDEITYTFTITSGGAVYTKTITKIFQETEVIFEDSESSLINWTSDTWSTTGEDFFSPSNSITDSQGGNYANNTSNSITLANEIDLNGVKNPELSFQAKWNIEDNWDYVQLFISSNNGTTWVPLKTTHTNIGTGSFQPAGQDLFDGNSNWVSEVADLSTYIGEFVKFRFELHSDGAVNADGFYFDDFSILSVLTSASTISDIQENKIVIYPNPAANKFSMFIPENVDVRQIQLLNLTGKTVKTYENISKNFSLDCSGISKGIYFIKLVTEDGIFLKKLIIE